MKLDELKERKRDLGFTNEHISKLSGVPLGTVQKVFAGVTKSPRYKTLKAIEGALYGNDIMPETLMVCDSRRDGSDDVPESEKQKDAACIRSGSNYDPHPVVKEEAFDYYSGTADEQLRQKSGQVIRRKVQGEFTLEDYYNMPEDWRGELIDGVIYDMTAPYPIHQVIAGYIYTLLMNHVLDNGGECLPMIAPVDVQLDCDEKTMVEPDVLILCDRSKLIERCIYGAPDLVMEVLSKSTKKKDMTIKLHKYQNAGVREYWVIDPKGFKIIVYEFEKEEFASIYTFDDVVPVGIWDGAAEIDFRKIADYAGFLRETSD